MQNQNKRTDNQTIEDFGNQWSDFTENEGYYGSNDCLDDILSGLIKLEELKGIKAADIGSGSGRIVSMLLQSGVDHVIAIEPSKAMDVLKKNLKDKMDQITTVHKTGEAIGEFKDLDMVISLGVLHHILDPKEVLDNAYKSLKPGGRILVWLYGHEGNELYLMTFGNLRKLTRKMPDFLLKCICHILNIAIWFYIKLCKFIPMPMHKYMNEHLKKLSWDQRYITIFDQLNPFYAKYYKEDEARALLEKSGFENVQLHHRHGYSWTVLGHKSKDVQGGS